MYALSAFPQVASSGDELSHLLKKNCFFRYPVLWLLNRLHLQGKFRQYSQNVEPPQNWKNIASKRFVEGNSFAVKVYSCTKKKVASLGPCTEHSYLYLVTVAVSVLQFNATTVDGETIALLINNSVTHS